MESEIVILIVAAALVILIALGILFIWLKQRYGYHTLGGWIGVSQEPPPLPMAASTNPNLEERGLFPSPLFASLTLPHSTPPQNKQQTTEKYSIRAAADFCRATPNGQYTVSTNLDRIGARENKFFKLVDSRDYGQVLMSVILPPPVLRSAASSAAGGMDSPSLGLPFCFCVLPLPFCLSVFLSVCLLSAVGRLCFSVIQFFFVCVYETL